MTTPRWPVMLFDLDGTLADTINAIVASYIHAWGSVGRRVTREEVLPWIGRTLTDVFVDEAPGQAAELEEIYMEHSKANLDTLVTGYDGVSELLTELVAAGVRTAVVTSKRRETAEMTMRLVGLPEQTLLAVARQDTDRHKPDPTPLLVGLEAIGGRPDDSCYVGDAVVDLQAAHAAGMAGVGVTWGAGDPAALRLQPSVGVADTVAELRTLLFN
ncbi:MAG: HAD family hydrolase [Brooklawnia sp.]|jgi:pyrophosphatase PpaX